MLETLKATILAAIEQAIRHCFGEQSLPPLTLGLPPSVELGDFTFGVFPLAKPLRKGPPIIAKELAAALARPELSCPVLSRVEAVGPYLNLTVTPSALFEALVQAATDLTQPFGLSKAHAGQRVLVEFSSPNTNKPLHIGHLRNIALGWSVSKLLEAVGYDVVKACLVNDRGAHICKSMWAHQRFFPAETPASRGQKGDHFVGDCYVAFAKVLKAEKEILTPALEAKGLTGDPLDRQAEAQTPIMQEVREMLLRWEAGDAATLEHWRTMNQWVYAGFDKTYSDLGVAFDKYYYESELYTKGKGLILEGLEKGLFEKRADGSVWVDLSADGMDPKVLLRADGTSLYITQDIGVSVQKWEDYHLDRSIYVIGSEQDHQMRALFAALKKMEYAWADGLYHLSYGMVYLPDGKMKSREGTVVDADDLMTELFAKAREKAQECNAADPRRSSDELPEEELAARARMVGLGAIKFFMLKVNPRKDFIFVPEESVQLTGDTGPYVQYTHARGRSVLRRGAEDGLLPSQAGPHLALLGNNDERLVARLLIDFPRVVSEAGERLMPSSVAGYLTELASAYNRFYHNHSVLKAETPELVLARLALTDATCRVLARGLDLLGIEAPQAM